MGAPKTQLRRSSQFELTRFFPYRLAVLADRVSNAVAQVYADRFDLSRAEWRILAALGANGEMAASEVGPYSTLDKMQVSRAVARHDAAGLIARNEDANDRRSKPLSLTAAGVALLTKVTPLVTAREAYLLETLSHEERKALDRAMEIILSRADALVRRG